MKRRWFLLVTILTALAVPIAAQVDPAVPTAAEEQLTPAEEVAIEEGAVATVEAVASGEASAAEASRDPATAVDLGATWQVAILSALFMAILAPMTTAGLKKLGVVAPELASGANLAVAVAYYLIAWWLLHGRYPDLPQDPLAWAGIALAGGGIGQAIRSVKNNWAVVFSRLVTKLTTEKAVKP